MTTEMMKRAGHYVSQPSGYCAFLPAPLPPRPPIVMDAELRALLAKAEQSIARLNESMRAAKCLVPMYMRKEALASSQIEGIQATLRQLLMAEAHCDTSCIPKEVKEVANYVKAMQYGLDGSEFSLRLVKKTHQILMREKRHALPGKWRTVQNWIGPAGCSLRRATFVPPPPSEIEGAMKALGAFLEADAGHPALIQIGLAHGQFETIHPFVDGNGRVGRLLITLLLAERAGLAQPALYISEFIKCHREEYYRRLQAIRDVGDWEGWLAFFLRGICATTEHAMQMAADALRLHEDCTSTVHARLGRIGTRVIKKLIDQPIVRKSTVQTWLGANAHKSDQVISTLSEAGVLAAIDCRCLCFEPYIQLLEKGL